MNIGILTLPLYNNYGGILQAFALNTVLQQMGHNPILLKRYSNSGVLSFYLKKLLGKFGVSRYSGKRYRKITTFVKREFNASSNLLSHEDFVKATSRYNLGALIVGSDQVWRREFCKGSNLDYFLDLDTSNTKRIAYAASFGVDSWDFLDKETETISELLKKFSGVSLREETFIPTLLKNTGCNAKWCLDPTLLLDSSQYKKMVGNRPMESGYTFIYWLGSMAEMKKHIPSDKKIIQIRLDDLECCSIEDWLTYIYYADNIITDSFHGCVFSLLFHKKLNVLKNSNGGISRIISLFKMFEIENLLENPDYFVDFDEFEKKLMLYRKRSMDFICNALIS